MNNLTKGVLIGSGIAAASTAAMIGMTQLTSGYFVRLALDRGGVPTIEKRMARLSGSPLTPDVLAHLKYKAKQLSLCCTDARLKTADGLTLVGHWRECADPKRVIIAMHGWRSGWARDFGMIADFWHDNGCCVLYPEQRGQGGSEGQYIGFGMLERHDCRAWIDWVNRKTGGQLPIYLAGISMGATTVLMTAGMVLPENVHGVIADCGFTSADAIWRHVAQHNLHMSYGLYATSANAHCRKRICMGAGDYSTLDAMADCEVPVLFIHGTDDNFVPVEMTYENYKACRAPKHLLVVPGANHGMSYRIDRAAYERAVLKFWDKYDKKHA